MGNCLILACFPTILASHVPFEKDVLIQPVFFKLAVVLNQRVFNARISIRLGAHTYFGAVLTTWTTGGS